MIVARKGLGVSATHSKSTNLQSQQCRTRFLDVGLLALLSKRERELSLKHEGGIERESS